MTTTVPSTDTLRDVQEAASVADSRADKCSRAEASTPRRGSGRATSGGGPFPCPCATGQNAAFYSLSASARSTIKTMSAAAQ